MPHEEKNVVYPTSVEDRSKTLYFAPAFTILNRRRIIAALIVLLACTFAFNHVDRLLTRPYGSFATDLISMRLTFRLYLVLIAGMSAGWLLQPVCLELLNGFQGFLPSSARVPLRVGVLCIACLMLSAFLIVFGRHQFGAWDFGILIDTGWRELQGQRPYVDFLAPTPPFFNYTSALAFRLFGVTWDANLYFAALFSCITLLWAYLLLRKLGMQCAAALGTATLIECAAMLSCCFWWYNNSTLVLAALFFLNSLLLLEASWSLFAQGSFIALAAVLPLTKPNIAGICLTGCLLLLLGASPKRGRVLLLTVAGFVLCLALSHFLMHISWPALFSTYRGIAKERGGASSFGFQSLTVGERRITVLWVILLCLPLLGIWRPIWAAIRDSKWPAAAFWLFFPFSALVAASGIAGNGEWRDVECTVLVSAIALLAFWLRTDSSLLRRSVVALMCGMAAADLYVGVVRLRVYTVGAHRFFEWSDNEHLIASSFFNHVRGSATLAEVDAETRKAVRQTSGSVFFGPRLEFEYAVRRLPSPKGWPTFFQPGTSFDRALTPELVRTWERDQFDTLVFLKDDYVFYPDELMDRILKSYVRDDHFPLLTVYRRRLAS